MRSVIVSIIAFSAIAAHGCSPASESDSNADANDAADAGDQMELAQPADACAVLESRDWRAWVNAMPGPDAAATLIVEGEVDMPTPDYEFAWEVGMADRSAIPMQRLHFKATPPEGMAAEVITTEAVRYEGPAIAQSYRAVVVVCGDETLAEIEDVTTAH